VDAGADTRVALNENYIGNSSIPADHSVVHQYEAEPQKLPGSKGGAFKRLLMRNVSPSGKIIERDRLGFIFLFCDEACLERLRILLSQKDGFPKAIDQTDGTALRTNLSRTVRRTS